MQRNRFPSPSIASDKFGVFLSLEVYPTPDGDPQVNPAEMSASIQIRTVQKRIVPDIPHNSPREI